MEPVVVDADPSWVPSHYRVCKKMAMPREPKILTPPDEILYSPTSLKQVAAFYVASHHPPSLHSQLPLELQALVREVGSKSKRGTQSVHYAALQRHCAQESVDGAIKIGNFGMFPTALLEAQPTPGFLFRTNMIEQAKAVLRFLMWTISDDPIATLTSDHRIVRHTLLHRYPHFLNMQLEALPTLLVPPKDVAQVWFFHMLQSNIYEDYLKSAFPRSFSKIYSVAHSCLLSADEIAKGTALCLELWSKKPSRAIGPYVLKDEPSWSDQAITVPHLPRAEDVVDDKQWITQFLKATSRIEKAPENDAFLRRSLLGYQRFMFLMAKWNQKMEFIGFSPCPAIDLMWHTHLVQPAEYRRFSMLLLYNVHHHKLLPPKDRTKMVYAKKDEPDAIWFSEFGESQSIYLLPLQGPISSSLKNSFTCDACEKPIQPKSVRYHCQICQDFDLCAECQKAQKTPGSHLVSHTVCALNVH